MTIKLDSIDLIKSSSSRDKPNEDLRTVLGISVTDKRNIVESPISGSDGNVLQDIGVEPVLITLEGEILGSNAGNVVQDITSKYEARKAIPFHSELTVISEVSKVLIKNFQASQKSGLAKGYQYRIDLVESRE